MVIMAVTSHLGRLQPAAGFLVIRGPLSMGFELLLRMGLGGADATFGTVQHDAVHEADDTAVRRVHRQHRVKEQTGMHAVAAPSAFGQLGCRQPNAVEDANDKQQLPPMLNKIVAFPRLAIPSSSA
jgi:hypothetical protein